MTKLGPEWVRTSDPVIRSPARYRWTTAPAWRAGRKMRLAVENNRSLKKSSHELVVTGNGMVSGGETSVVEKLLPI